MPTVGGGKYGKGGDMMAKKMSCGCGCVPPGKTVKTKNKSKNPKTPKKPAK
jgi:hypothetical protein